MARRQTRAPNLQHQTLDYTGQGEYELEKEKHNAYGLEGLRSRNSVYEAYGAKYRTEDSYRQPYLDSCSLSSLDLEITKHP